MHIDEPEQEESGGEADDEDGGDGGAGSGSSFVRHGVLMFLTASFFRG
jgi:hypothetical protein